jgi:hypothetical protein
MNTFFPTLQLFFQSGRSCTIEGARLSGAVVGLDPMLRFRLTDLTHEEDGRLLRTTLPEKFVGSIPSVAILDATVACRTSIVVKQNPTEGGKHLTSMGPSPSIVEEQHMVVGLRLQGMRHIAYVWTRAPTASGHSTWGNMRIAGLRDDVPAPSFGFPQEYTKLGGEVMVVQKESMIRRRQ